MDLIFISQQGLGACWLSASAAGGGPTLPSAGRPAVCINLSSDPDAHLETARALSAALCLEIPAAYLVLRRGGLRMLYPCPKNSQSVYHNLNSSLGPVMESIVI